MTEIDGECESKYHDCCNLQTDVDRLRERAEFAEITARDAKHANVVWRERAEEARMSLEMAHGDVEALTAALDRVRALCDVIESDYSRPDHAIVLTRNVRAAIEGP